MAARAADPITRKRVDSLTDSAPTPTKPPRSSRNERELGQLDVFFWLLPANFWGIRVCFPGFIMLGHSWGTIRRDSLVATRLQNKGV